MQKYQDVVHGSSRCCTCITHKFEIACLGKKCGIDWRGEGGGGNGGCLNFVSRVNL